MRKKIVFIFLLCIIFKGCKKDDQVNLHDNISVYPESFEINNINGKFGRTIINKNMKLNFILINNHSGTAENINATFDNNNFKFLNGYPGINYTSSTSIKPPCTFNLNSKSECTLAVSFDPDNENFVYGNLIITYEVNSKQYVFKFPLIGVGVKQTKAQELLGKLKKSFSPVNKLTEPSPHKTTLIETILAVGHSQKFAYDDYFNSLPSKNIEVINKQLSLKRVIGFTFRGDTRSQVIDYKDCEDDWKYGFNIIDPKTGNEISYPGHPGAGCGIKDVGGFFPTFTRKKDIEKINNLLIDYKKNYGKDFDPTIDNFRVLTLYPTAPFTFFSNISETDVLNWWLQSTLNIAAHTAGFYEYKGFISTTTNIFIADKFSKNGTVYALYQEGGYLLPEFSDPKNQLSGGGALASIDENEVAVPGAVDWDDVVAYYNKSEKILMVRDGLKEMDSKAYDEIINEFSHIM
ncbi:hypothetical protein [Fluviispira sanaruensis]|uniref:Uncharacterized protein n=1 Tax=Fluviispira sanaruensis TaxID=2493639 RepID=A0A4P2VKN3_FLUSA|nr:hypothetical protein [Fluviispira sanaruensis]BBH53341.1 hypothetical protein JCM31447_17840 [Fluviispira sanaruensis]